MLLRVLRLLVLPSAWSFLALSPAHVLRRQSSTEVERRLQRDHRLWGDHRLLCDHRACGVPTPERMVPQTVEIALCELVLVVGHREKRVRHTARLTVSAQEPARHYSCMPARRGWRMRSRCRHRLSRHGSHGLHRLASLYLAQEPSQGLQVQRMLNDLRQQRHSAWFQLP